MRRTLRRSCAACAKAKHSCDLQTPKCTRCTERRTSCVYANEPLNAVPSSSSSSTGAASSRNGGVKRVVRMTRSSQSSQLVQIQGRAGSRTGSGSPDVLPLMIMAGVEGSVVDPFDTYPATSLPRARVQGLIHHFLSKIIFQYYPWDISPNSNPFVTSWWHLALSDPALFHVSLQTASLDDELLAQKGFVHSEVLMRDSVRLLREKVESGSRAVEDETCDAVITLAAIEHGKGNLAVSRLHVEGVKKMVEVRGGISSIKVSNPLTARMVAWVCLLVMGSPQFLLEDDTGLFYKTSMPYIDDSSVITNSAETIHSSQLDLQPFGLDPNVEETVLRLRTIFSMENINPGYLPIAQRQDLTSFIIHRLLLLPTGSSPSISEAIRIATCIYMIIIHGPTYYSHMAILKDLVLKLQEQLITILELDIIAALRIWLLSIGVVGSIGTEEHEWFIIQCSKSHLPLNWDEVKQSLANVLWLDGPYEITFRQTWDCVPPIPTVGNAQEVRT